MEELRPMKRVGTLTIHGVDTMTQKQRLKVVSWLKRQMQLIEYFGGKKGKMSKRYTAKYNVLASLLALCLLISGCVTKYDDIVSDFHTIQVGPRCTTVGFDQRKFNAETTMPDALTCRCDQLISVKRLAKKANQSPEGWSCPDVVNRDQYQTSIVPSVHLHHQASLASSYVPAIGNAAAGAAIGGGIAAAQAARMTQSIGGQTIRTSTVVAEVPAGVAR